MAKVILALLACLSLCCLAHCDGACGVPRFEMEPTERQAAGGARVIGGQHARPWSHPWIVKVQIKRQEGNLIYTSDCGGSLIRVSEKNETDIVITAAHCVYDSEKKQPKPGNITVTASLHWISLKHVLAYQEVQVKKAIWHEDYNFDGVWVGHDMAALILSEPIFFNDKVQPACLPIPDHRVPVGDELIIAGWGRTADNGTGSDVLRQVGLTVVDYSSCQSNSASKFTDAAVVCASGGDPQISRDNCRGDSGGPAVQKIEDRYVLQGLVSFTMGACGRPGVPGGYTRVSNYIQWIYDMVYKYSAVYNDNPDSGLKGFVAGVPGVRVTSNGN